MLPLNRWLFFVGTEVPIAGEPIEEVPAFQILPGFLDCEATEGTIERGASCRVLLAARSPPKYSG